MEDIARFIPDAQKPIPSVKPNLPKGLYLAVEFNPKNYHSTASQKPGRVAFVDGGNAELVKAPNFSVHLIRVVGVVFEGLKRKVIKKYEFRCGVRTIGETSLKYQAKIFPLSKVPELGVLEFDSYDKTLMLGNNRVSISRIGGLVRRLCELTIAKLLTQEYSPELLVLDGNLEASRTYEQEHLAEVYSTARNHSTMVCGLAKTSTMLMDGGEPMLGFIKRHGPRDESWWYHPIAISHTPKHLAEICVVKLHPKSRYAFRLDINPPNLQPGVIDKVVAWLCGFSVDVASLGYPYGLVFADKIARISKQESSLVKSQFLLGMPKSLLEFTFASDFHDHLNRV